MAGVRLRGEADIRVAPIQVFQPLGELDTGEGHGTHIEPWEKLSSAGECFTYPSPIPAGGIPMGSGSTPSEPEDWLDGLTRNQLALIALLGIAVASIARFVARGPIQVPSDPLLQLIQPSYIAPIIALVFGAAVLLLRLRESPTLRGRFLFAVSAICAFGLLIILLAEAISPPIAPLDALFVVLVLVLCGAVIAGTRVDKSRKRVRIAR